MSEMLDCRVVPGFEELQSVNTDALIWAHRALLYCGGLKGVFRNGHCRDDELAEILGIGDLVESPDELDLATVRVRLEKGLQKLESEYQKDPGVVGGNLELLARSLGLDETERALVHFAAALQIFGWLLDALQYMRVSGVGSAAAASVLAKILDRPAAGIRQALRPQGLLREAGLFKAEDRSGTNLFRMLNLLEGLADRLYGDAHKDVHSLLDGLFDASPEPELEPEDFVHIDKDYALMRDYLGEAIERRTRGVNILLHGEPGVGKTQLVRTLCKALDVHLYEVAGGEGSGNARIRVFLFAEAILRDRGDCVILFDEIEDVFPVRNPWFRERSALSKANTNRLLENNPVPAFWLANDIEQIDPAYLRRFDLVIEVRKPGREAREKFMDRYFDEDALHAGCRAALLKDDEITPAAIERASRVLDHLSLSDEGERDGAVMRIFRHNQRALGHKPPHLPVNGNLPYVKDAINTSTPIDAIAIGLQDHGTARLCLHGPPGTGKSEWARQLAERLDRLLIAKRYSEIESAYVGVCEKNIARMFEEAADRDAVLLLDEADSLLRNRALADRGWERTRVNEMLAQMESFPGIFIATTNTLDEVDAAAMRRFDFKVRFDYLKPDQAQTLANAFLKANGEPGLDPSYAERLGALRVAPGDFAVIARQIQVCGGLLTADTLLNELEAELSYRVVTPREGRAYSTH